MISRKKKHPGEIILISYEKLWATMKEKGITQYSLIKKYHVSAGQLSRLRSNSYVSTHTIDLLWKILCSISRTHQPPLTLWMQNSRNNVLYPIICRG